MELLLVFVLAFFVYRLRCQVRDLRTRVDRLSGEDRKVTAPEVDLEAKAPMADRPGPEAPERSAQAHLCRIVSGT